MFNKISAADLGNEVAEAMQKELIAAVVEKETEPLNKYAAAMDALNKAAEILDEIGLTKEAEYTTTLLEVVARKKKTPKSKSKSKSKSKPAKKSVDPEMKDLTSEKMVENLKHKGWVFNADDEKKHSHGCMCSMCMDVNDIRHGDDCVCSFCMDDDWDSRYKLEADDRNFHFDTESDASSHIDRNSANDWNLSDIFDMDFEDEIDLPRPRR